MRMGSSISSLLKSSSSLATLSARQQELNVPPHARIAGYFEETLDDYRGPGNSIWSQEFYETDRSRGFVRGYTFEFSRGQVPVMAAVPFLQAEQGNAALLEHGDSREQLAETVKAHDRERVSFAHGMQIGRLPWDPEHHGAYRKLFCHRTGMVAICEDLPEEHNTVTLDPVLTDSIDTNSAAGELVFHVFGAIAHFERRQIDERTKDGIAAARAKGKQSGTPTPRC